MNNSKHQTRGQENRNSASAFNKANVTANVPIPRSAMEAKQLLNPNAGGPKFRQLPCRTFNSVGSCPYKDKCVYLHDYRLAARDHTKGKAGRGRKNKEDVVLDAYFWPCLPAEHVQSILDSEGLPSVNQMYNVPYPDRNGDPHYENHDAASSSMWTHFTDFCQRCNEETVPGPRRIGNFDRMDCNAFYNGSSKDRRMPTFRNLSRGAHARYAITPPPAPAKSPEQSIKLDTQQEQLSFAGYRHSAVLRSADVLMSRSGTALGVDSVGTSLSMIDPATEFPAKSPKQSIKLEIQQEQQSSVGFKDCLGDHFPDFHSISTTLTSRAEPCELRPLGPACVSELRPLGPDYVSELRPLGPDYESELDVNPYSPPSSPDYEMFGHKAWGLLGRKSPTIFAAATKLTLIHGFKSCAKPAVHLHLALSR